MIPELMSTEQVARVLHCSRHTVGNLRTLGILPGVHLGHGYQYDPADVTKAVTLMKSYTLESIMYMNPEKRLSVLKRFGITQPREK